jgi:hypothetical protein
MNGVRLYGIKDLLQLLPGAAVLDRVLGLTTLGQVELLSHGDSVWPILWVRTLVHRSNSSYLTAKVHLGFRGLEQFFNHLA